MHLKEPIKFDCKTPFESFTFSSGNCVGNGHILGFLVEKHAREYMKRKGIKGPLLHWKRAETSTPPPVQEEKKNTSPEQKVKEQGEKYYGNNNPWWD